MLAQLQFSQRCLCTSASADRKAATIAQRVRTKDVVLPCATAAAHAAAQAWPTAAANHRWAAAPAAAAAAPGPQCRSWVCCYTKSPSAAARGDVAAADARKPLGALDPLIQVAVNTTSSGVAKAVLMRLQRFGHVEIWATSAANHFTAISGVGLAAQQLQQQPLQLAQHSKGAAGQQQEQVAGLAATAVLTAHDQQVKDQQKQRLNKLQLQVQPAEQLDPAVLTAGQAGSISSNRTTSIADILGCMQQQLLEVQDNSSSRVKPGALCVVEARGEQAVTRALKAALSLQAAAGQNLLLRPVAGKVVDIVAEKRGQALLADGLLLLFTWA